MRLANALICRDRLSRPIQSIFDGGLHEFITDFLRANAALARQIERDYRFVGVTMRLRVDHSTHYNFDAPVGLCAPATQADAEGPAGTAA